MKKTVKRYKNRKRQARLRSLSPELWDRIKREARMLGLSREEYIRLLLSFSGIVRNSVPGASQFNATQLLNIVENPLFQAAFSFIAQSTLSRFGQENDKAEEQGSTANESQSNSESTRTEPQGLPSQQGPQPPVQPRTYFDPVPEARVPTLRHEQNPHPSDVVSPQNPYWEYW
jgi:hypothetical protein